ncbi:putative signal transduction protein with CBS domains [Paenibacillus curdlanolyticus YK9]|uniref:Putative signal transduction protein with CBS domains n=1 Tax=Paenibacillus curdlanolyticus YK9 TaxID=717606 RepID=E0I6U6_9BACL|nr:helix-turn-helix transcriptional regulator [Paenibacillus curdlanolyticus]EFM11762.1 putative signal transduction protein with CBS domains [Paenibacillus curdlanolyticus YK9]
MELVQLVKQHAPITGEQLAEMLGVSRPTLRSDLSLLVMLGMLDAKPKVGYSIGNAYRTDHSAIRRFHELTVGQVQGVPVSVPETYSVHDAVVTLYMANADTLLVVNEQQKFVGIVTPKDLLKVTLGNPSAGTIPVSMVMTRYPNIVTASPEDAVADAISKMLAHQVNCLPVVIPDGNGAPGIAGWITKSNIVHLVAELTTDTE